MIKTWYLCQKTCILSSPSAKRARAVNDRQLKPMQWQGQAMIGPGSNKRMVLSWVPVPPILFYKIKVLDETYLWDISGKKSCWRDYNCRAIVNANELLKRRLWPSWTETFHQQCQQMCGKWMKIRILVAAKVKYWIMDALWNPSRAKAKKKLEASEKLNFVTLYTLCTWFCPRSRNKQAGKLQSLHTHTHTHTHTLNPHSLGGRKAKIMRRAKKLFMLLPPF